MKMHWPLRWEKKKEIGLLILHQSTWFCCCCFVIQFWHNIALKPVYLAQERPPRCKYDPLRCRASTGSYTSFFPCCWLIREMVIWQEERQQNWDAIATPLVLRCFFSFLDLVEESSSCPNLVLWDWLYTKTVPGSRSQRWASSHLTNTQCRPSTLQEMIHFFLKCLYLLCVDFL